MWKQFDLGQRNEVLRGEMVQERQLPCNNPVLHDNHDDVHGHNGHDHIVFDAVVTTTSTAAMTIHNLLKGSNKE